MFSFNSLVDQTGARLSLGHAVSGSHSQVNATLWEEVKLLSGFYLFNLSQNVEAYLM